MLPTHPLIAWLIGTKQGCEAVRDAMNGAGLIVRESTDLPRQPDDAVFACVVLDHPDQFAGEQVRRFLSKFAGVRIVCIGMPWCASLLRSRGDWPASTVIDVSEVPRRLRQEVERLRGNRPPLPLTAGLEEVAAANQESELEAIGRGRTARIACADRVYRETVGLQLREAGFEIVDESQRVDMLVVDADQASWMSPSGVDSDRAAMHVLLTSIPDRFEAPVRSDVIVASKFAPVGDWIRRVLFAACVVMAISLTGCGAKVAPQPEATKPAEKTWAEQVDAVRRGSATSIVTTKPVTSSDWAALATDCAALEVLEAEQADLVTTDFDRLHLLPKLRRLKLGSSLDDRAAAVLSKHPALAELVVSSDALTDAGMIELCELPLVQLRLQAPHVTDAAMTSMGSLDQLRFLHLIDVPLTDAGLPPLAGIKSLESLYLDRTKCSDEGLSALLKQRPDIHFHRDQTHLRDDPRKDGH